MQMMKAAVVHEFGKPLVIEEVPVLKVVPGQVLVKVAAIDDAQLARRRSPSGARRDQGWAA